MICESLSPDMFCNHRLCIKYVEIFPQDTLPHLANIPLPPEPLPIQSPLPSPSTAPTSPTPSENPSATSKLELFIPPYEEINANKSCGYVLSPCITQAQKEMEKKICQKERMKRFGIAYPSGFEDVQHLIGNAQDYWFKMGRRQYKQYQLPTQFEAESAMFIFSNHVERHKLLIGETSEISSEMNFLTADQSIEDIESVLFLMKSYFEGFSMSLTVDFKVDLSWQKFGSWSHGKNHLCTISVRAIMGMEMRKHVMNEYNKIMSQDFVKLVDDLYGTDSYKLPGSAVTRKFYRIKRVAIKLDYWTEERPYV